VERRGSDGCARELVWSMARARLALGSFFMPIFELGKNLFCNLTSSRFNSKFAWKRVGPGCERRLTTWAVRTHLPAYCPRKMALHRQRPFFYSCVASPSAPFYVLPSSYLCPDPVLPPLV
jgi:hypothetical protein